jgi:hypothetical protein
MGETMKASKYLVGALAFVMLSLSAAQASAENILTENVIYAEGVDMHGVNVVPATGPPATLVGSADNVIIDWSDNIVFHQFSAGSKVRTEVILHQLADDGTYYAAVYTLTAHLQIAPLNDDGTPGEAVYSSSVAQGVFTDKRNDYYSAEVNEDGLLLYGYNWDTRAMGCGAGWYRLTFWLEKDNTCPNVNPITGTPIVYNAINIDTGAPGDTSEESGTIYGLVDYDFDNNMSWIDIELVDKDHGRESSGSAHWNPDP